MGLLRRGYGIQPAGVWDSQQAASLLGWPQTGYGALVERLCGVSLAKGHAFYDWARRPLAPEPLRYALDDVRYLPTVCRRLRELVHEADLDEEVEIAGQAVATATWNGDFRPEGLWRIKGVRQLDRRQLPVLTALWVVARPDRARGRHARRSPDSTTPCCWPSPGRRRASPTTCVASDCAAGRFDRWGGAILDAVESARRDPPPVPEPPQAPRADPVERERNKRLRDWRRQEASASRRHRAGRPARRRAAPSGPERCRDLDAVPQLGAKRIGLYADTLARLAS